MFETSYIISPVAGAIIGYFTNWLAIKMLFRPHNEKRIGDFKIPFTPGLIPKEKERIAESLGEAVGNYILTSDAFKEAMSRPEVTESLEDAFDKAVLNLKASDKTLDMVLESILKEEKEEIINEIKDFIYKKSKIIIEDTGVKNRALIFIYKKITEFLDMPIKELSKDIWGANLRDFLVAEARTVMESGVLTKSLEKSAWEYLLSLKTDERRLSEVISYQTLQSLKDYASLKLPYAVNSLIELSSEPETESKLKESFKELLYEKIGFAGMFVNGDDLYYKFINAIEGYVNNPEKSEDIYNAISLVIDRVMEKSLGESIDLITGEIREAGVNKAITAAANAFTKEETLEDLIDKAVEFFTSNQERTLNNVLREIIPGYREALKETVEDTIQSMIKEKGESFGRELIDKYADKLLRLYASDILNLISPKALKQFKFVIFSRYEGIMDKVVPYAVNAIDVSGMVKRQVNSFDTEYTENLILSIVKKELSAITWAGGVLGFLIGLIPVLIQMI